MGGKCVVSGGWSWVVSGKWWVVGGGTYFHLYDSTFVVCSHLVFVLGVARLRHGIVPTQSFIATRTVAAALNKHFNIDRSNKRRSHEVCMQSEMHTNVKYS